MAKQTGKQDAAVEAKPRAYRATTGLENADGVRVELGEVMPAGFVPGWQVEQWVLNGDLAEVETDAQEDR